MAAARQFLMVVGVLCASVSTGYAAHPLQTEDTGTQGNGNVEIENGLSRLHQGPLRLLIYQPQVSVGIGSALDVIVQPSWLVRRVDPDPAERGFGDTNLDAKWRFFGATPWSLATRFGAGIATNQRGLGIEHGTWSPHLVMVATYEAAPLTLHGNIGTTHVPAGGDLRENIFSVSSAAMWSLNEHWILTGDLGAATNPDRSGRALLVTALAGVIWTIRPGLDADLGYQRTLGARSAAITWLLGLTYRFAP